MKRTGAHFMDMVRVVEMSDNDGSVQWAHCEAPIEELDRVLEGHRVYPLLYIPCVPTQ